jgi:hypothetical protein
MKVLMKFDDVVVQGLEQRFVDRNGRMPSIYYFLLGFLILKLTSSMNIHQCQR